MQLIVGLGNPGNEYERTRHNVGFMLLDTLYEQWEFPPFSDEKRFLALISTDTLNGEKVLLVKPTTFMNRSGDAVATIVHFYKITPSDITVIHDDLDIPFGTIKITDSSRAAGHNGVQDIIDALGTQNFPRIRIGISRPKDGHLPADHVLDRFTPEEESKLPDIFASVLTSLVLKDKKSRTMLRLQSK